jgi:hypothetical protein
MSSARKKTRSKKIDYDTVSDNLRTELREAAERIRGHFSKEEAAKRERLTEAINAGRELQEVQNKLEYGQFLEWIDTEFDKASRTVERYQRLAIVFGHRIDTVSDLGLGKAHLLAQKSTPEIVVEQVLERTSAGDPPSYREIQRLVKAEQERLKAEQRAKEGEVENTETAAAGIENDRSGKPVNERPIADGVATGMEPTVDPVSSTAEAPAGSTPAGGMGDGSADEKRNEPADLEEAPQPPTPKAAKPAGSRHKLFPSGLPVARRAKATLVKAVHPDQTAVEEPAPPTGMTEEHGAEAGDHRSKEFYAARQAQRCRHKARLGLTKIVRTVQSLVTLPVPPPGNLDELLSPQDQAKIRRYWPKVSATLKAYEPVINSSATADE